MENTKEIVPLKITAEEPVKKLAVVDENEEDKKAYLREQAKKGVLDLEVKKQAIENSQNPEDKEKIFEEVSEIEKLLDGIETKLSGLDIDQEMILNMYGDLTKEDVAAEVKESGAEAFISNLVRNDPDGAKRIANEKGFNPAQLAVLIACFLFLMLGSMTRKAEGSDLNSARNVEISRETEKSDVDKFLTKLEIVEVFQKQQSFLDMKIPAKPKGHENQEWEIQLIGQEGFAVGHFNIEDKITYATFGKNKEGKVEKARLVIKEGDKIIEEINIDIF